MDIINKAKRPLLVPLPGGKKLHLPLGATGQISPKAVDHPPLKKLVEAGDVELVEDHPTHAKSGNVTGGAVGGASQPGSPNKNIRRSGDR